MKVIACVASLLVFLVAQGCVSGSPGVFPSDFHKGIDIFAGNSTILAQPALLQELKEIAKIGANWVPFFFPPPSNQKTNLGEGSSKLRDLARSRELKYDLHKSYDNAII